MLHVPQLSILDHTGPAVRAELSGDDKASAYGYTAVSSSPVLALCRDLIDAGHLSTEPMECWRGATLCLRLRSLEEGATLEVNSKGTGFINWRSAVRTGPLVKSKARGAI